MRIQGNRKGPGKKRRRDTTRVPFYVFFQPRNFFSPHRVSSYTLSFLGSIILGIWIFEVITIFFLSTWNENFQIEYAIFDHPYNFWRGSQAVAMIHGYSNFLSVLQKRFTISEKHFFFFHPFCSSESTICCTFTAGPSGKHKNSLNNLRFLGWRGSKVKNSPLPR